MYKLTAAQQVKTSDYVSKRLVDPSRYEDAKDLASLELNYVTIERLLDNDIDLLDLWNRDEFVQEDIVQVFANSDFVPVRVDFLNKVVIVIHTGCSADIEPPHLEGYSVVKKQVPCYIFFKKYNRLYGKHKDFLYIPPKNLFDNIMEEAIRLKAADITISTDGLLGRVYYNVAKKLVHSQIIISKYEVEEFIKLMCFQNAYDFASKMSKKIGFTINQDYRGRGQINKKTDGYVITIRLLSNSYFNHTLESINLDAETRAFLRKYVMAPDFGLRLIVGATMSGKNTTALACLREVISNKPQKVVSVEMPVEQYLPGIEQIDCDDAESYEDAVNSLIRQNPDYIYVTEMSEETAKSAIRISNTGKVMLSTLHANSCADTIGRLQDITGLSTDKLIQAVHCIVYQELRRDEKHNRVVPCNSTLYLSEDRKAQLYGKPYGEILALLKKWEVKNEQSLLTASEV